MPSRGTPNASRARAFRLNMDPERGYIPARPHREITHARCRHPGAPRVRDYGRAFGDARAQIAMTHDGTVRAPSSRTDYARLVNWPER